MKFFNYIKEQALRTIDDFTEIKCGKTHIAVKSDGNGVNINITDLSTTLSKNQAKELIVAIQKALK